MKLLVEKNILTSEEQDKFNKLKAGSIDKRDAYFELAKQHFGNDPDFDAYQTVLVDTFEKYGTDTSINRFLQFVVNKSNVDYNLTPEKAELVNNILINNESAVKTPAKNFWLYNPQSYNGPLYKIKALAFLSKPESDNYGDKKTKASIRDKILQSTDQNEIENLISQWNTKTGEKYYQYRRPRNNTNKKTDQSKPQSVKQAVTNGLVKYGYSTKDINAAISTVYKDGMSEESLASAVFKYFEEGNNVS